MFRKVAIIVLICLTPIGALLGGFLMLSAIFGSNAGAACKAQNPNGPVGTAPLNLPLFEAIAHDTRGNSNLALAMFMGSHIESGWRSTASDGAAYGPFQIQYPADAPRPPGVDAVHPDITIAQAENPAYATNYMLQAYKNALSTVDPLLWLLPNHEKAGEQTAYAAERPAQDYYVARGAATVHSAYLESLVAMKSVGIPTIFGPAPDPGQPDPGIDRAAPAECQGSFTPGPAGPKAQIVLQAIKSQLGVPYVWGAETPKSPTFEGAFDCSGLVIWAFHEAGINLPRVSQDQWKATRNHEVTGKQVQAGDLVFFAGSDGTMTEPGHIGIVVDPIKGVMINAPYTGTVVRYDTYAGAKDLVGFTHPYPPVISAPSPTQTPTPIHS